MNVVSIYRKVLMACGSALLVASLSGCTQPAEASNLQTPAIVWENGEPSGPFWDTEWAAAYREATKQTALAHAYGDYSDPDYVAAVGYDNAYAVAKANSTFRFRDFNNNRRSFGATGTWAFYGTILDIEESPDELTAVVRACNAQNGMVGYSARNLDWTITKSADGSHTASHLAGHLNDECLEAAMWIGVWAPPIDIENVGRDKVKMPLPREYYVKLGVIDE